MSIRRLLIPLILLIAGSLQAAGLDIPSRLTDGASREWVLQRWETVLDSSNACKQGVIWAFHTDGRLDIRRCLNGVTATDVARWSIVSPGEHYPHIAINGRRYEIEMLKKVEPAEVGLPPTVTLTTKLREVRKHTGKAVQEITLTHREF